MHHGNAQMKRQRINKRKRAAEIREMENVHDNEALCNEAISPERRTRGMYSRGRFQIRFGLGGWPPRVWGGDARGWSLVTVLTRL